MTPEQEQAIADLRSRNVAPKQIARQLGLRPAEVSAFLKVQAAQVTANRVAAGELNPLHQCLLNKNAWQSLTRSPESAETDDEMSEGAGFALVMVSRHAGFNRLEVGTYLVDIWCLGVKDAMQPRTIDPTTYRDFVEYAYRGFPDGYEEISLEQAQAIVFGAIDYAATLGFKPHRDFEAAKPLLGTGNSEPKLTFGRNGKPFYLSGPYDDPFKILNTLRETVGEGNFDFVMAAD